MITFIYRSCDLTNTPAFDAIQRSADVVNRAVALLQSTSGLPADDGAFPGTVTLPIEESTWQVTDGAGTIPPGTYQHAVIPVDRCTGHTGTAIPVAPLVIEHLGQEATLHLKLTGEQSQCAGFLVQRDGVIIGTAQPADRPSSASVVTAANLTGNFINGSASTFERVDGADLIIGDLVSYQDQSVRIVDIDSNVYTFEPPVAPVPQALPAEQYLIENRMGVYVNDPYPTIVGLFPFLMPYMGFKTLPITVPGLVSPQVGDLILYGAKTALIVAVSQATPIDPILVGIVPFSVSPVPPLPIGVWYLVARPRLPFSFTIGSYSELNKEQDAIDSLDPDHSPRKAFDRFIVTGEHSLDIGMSIAMNGAIVRVENIEVDKDIDGNDFEGKTRITISPGWGSLEQVSFPSFMADGIPNGVGIPDGIYATVPDILAQFLPPPAPTSSGQYRRLTRPVESRTITNALSVPFKALAERSGDLPANDAHIVMDKLLAQSAYPGGLSGLISRVRGSQDSKASDVFVRTNGMFTLLDDRLVAVNGIANLGTGVVIDLETMRNLWNKSGGKWVNAANALAYLTEHGFVAFRYRSVEKITPNLAACPPGQSVISTTDLVFSGVVSTSNKVVSNDSVKVIKLSVLDLNKVVKQLVNLGFTSDEANGVVVGEALGRVSSIEVITSSTINDAEDISTTSVGLDDVLSDERIKTVNLGYVTRRQVAEALAKRGTAGRFQHAAGYSDVYLEDFDAVGHNLLIELFTKPKTFSLCDPQAVLDAIPDANVRTALASYYAVTDALSNQFVSAGHALKQFMDNPLMRDAMTAIGGIVVGKFADPTLACMFGTQQSTISPGKLGIANLNASLKLLGLPLSARFNLTAQFMQMLYAASCSLVSAGVGLLGQFGVNKTEQQAVSRVIGCLPPLPEIALGAVSELLPTLDIQLSIECTLEKLYIMQDVLFETISEANEIISFLNSVGDGTFVANGVQAQNASCASGESLEAIKKSLALLLKL